MRTRRALLFLAALLPARCLRSADPDPPPELLENLELFREMDLAKDKDFWEGFDFFESSGTALAPGGAGAENRGEQKPL